MVGLPLAKSACVCGRDFDWRRLFEPNVSKHDPTHWIVFFGPDASDPKWQTACRMLTLLQRLIDPAQLGLLVVTAESADVQLAAELYKGLDCEFVRTLSDESGEVVLSLGIELIDRKYPFHVIQFEGGKEMNRL